MTINSPTEQIIVYYEYIIYDATHAIILKNSHSQLATNAFRGFAESLKSNRDKRGRKVNLIYSTQLIEEFAFRYASFNLNSTRNEERTENEHIGKSPSSGDQRFPRRSYPLYSKFYEILVCKNAEKLHLPFCLFFFISNL